jgi:rare lipoprotein A
MFRSLCLLSPVLLLAACQTTTPVEDKPAAAIAAAPAPAPRKAAPSLAARRHVHASRGRTYHGKASWYSIATNGGTATASGERLSNSAHTAAHRTLPFGTRVRVTNLRNGRSTVVRINDRGPYIKGRIIDVTKGVARKLGMVDRGVVKTKIEVLEPSS